LEYGLYNKSTKRNSIYSKKGNSISLFSGIATGISWLCYFYALQKGDTSVVVSTDKLSIIVTIFFSFLVFKEKLSIKAFLGLILVVVGTLLMLL
jgi:membrane protein